MIECLIQHLEQRCEERGYSIDEVRPCIVSQDGDVITVDESHPAYPRQPRKRPDQPPLPPLADRIANFARSAVRHVASGMRQCSEDEVNARYAICQACEWFRDGACAKCGCPVVRERQYISKLSWASESCPIGKWGPTTGRPSPS